MSPTSPPNQDRLFATLQRLLEIPAADLTTALTHAANALSEALRADKVDAFLYDESRDSLVAMGVSTQPLSNLERRLGLDVLPVSNGGTAARVFTSGEIFVSGNVQEVEDELRGIRDGLKIRSAIAVPLMVADRRRGVVSVTSRKRDFFTESDVAFVSSAARWVSVLAEHSELTASIERNALEEGRRSRAEEIITVLAHDLRNYLNPVVLQLYALRKRAAMEQRTADVGDVDKALLGISRVTSLMSDLLDTARLDGGAFQMRLEPLDIAALVAQSAAVLSSPEHPIAVKSAAPVIVAADRSRIRQCIDNVLANAVGHSPQHAPVDVDIAEEHRDGRAWARIEVVDQGPGIPDDVLPHVFDRFYTGRKQRGGVGLGLYIAHRIATAHGGDIVADTRPGKGARFAIVLPAVASDRGGAEPAVGPA
jgi:signal transduction histidine kinase